MRYVYINRRYIKVCILILIVLIIITNIFTKIQEQRSHTEGERLIVLYQLTQIKDDCNYSNDSFFLKIPDCHQSKVGNWLELTGRVESTTDKSFYSKKRLIIDEKIDFIPEKHSLNYWKSDIIRIKTQVWDFIATPVIQVLPHPHSVVLLSMVFGSSTELDDTTSDLFRLTGTTHLQAVSGYNFAVISAGIYQATKKLRNKRLQATAIFFVSLFYLYVVGAQASVIRAFLTLLIILWSKFFLIRQHNGKFSLVLVLFLMIFVKPIWIFSVSFQLSALATAGILIIYPKLSMITRALLAGYLNDPFRPVYIKKVVEELCDASLIGIAASITTFPILLFYFHELNLMGVLISALLNSLISFLVKTGFWIFLLGSLIYQMGASSMVYYIVIVALYFPVNFYIICLDYLKNTTFLTLHIENMTMSTVIFLYGLIVLFFYYIEKKMRLSQDRAGLLFV